LKARRKSTAPQVGVDEILPEYDLSHSRPNKYAARYAEGTDAVLLAPDVYRVFRSGKAVNDALRLVIKLYKVVGGR